METALKQLIKEAILEALVEFTNGGVATLSVEDSNLTVDDSKNTETGGNTNTSGEDNSGKGGDSGTTSGGGVGPGGRPKPDVGVGIFGLR
jgi:hypothetical protein